MLLITLLFATTANTGLPDSCTGYAEQLHTMAEIDQAMRARWEGVVIPTNAGKESQLPKIIQQTMLVDRVHARRLEALIRGCGWPSAKQQGKQATEDAWLLAQHVPPNLEFQNELFSKMNRAVSSGDVSAVNLAYFADSLAAQQGRPQEYGTQFFQTAPCRIEAAKMGDIATVNRRRAEIGLEPWEEYKQQVERQFFGASCSKEAAK